MPVAVSAQRFENPSWRKTEDPYARKNSITASLSVIAVSNYNALAPLANVSIEYDRLLTNSLSVSVVGMYNPLLLPGFMMDGGTMQEHFMFAGAKLNYTFQVARNVLYFKIGLGAGASIHSLFEYSRGMVEDEHWSPPPPPEEFRVKPRFMVDMYWILRVTPKVELRFAPLLISPSYLIYGSESDRAYNPSSFYFNFCPFGVTVRF